MPQDQLFKEVLQEFFREFLDLFYPLIAERLDFDRVTFLDKEAFTDLLEGRRREADLVAQVYTKDGRPEIVVVHVEVQTQRRPRTVPYRMFEYYALFRLRFRVPVLPIVLYLAPGAGGLVEETHVEELFGKEILRFTYRVIGLPDLQSEDYQTSKNPLGPALSVLMRPGAIGDALRKAIILNQQAIIEQNEARQVLLRNLIERYLPLNPAQEAEFERLVRQPDYAGIQEMISVYEERGIAIGIKKGIEQGLGRGLLNGMRRTLLRQMELRFGAIPPAVQAQIEAIETPPELETLLDRIVTAQSLQDMGLN